MNERIQISFIEKSKQFSVLVSSRFHHSNLMTPVCFYFRLNTSECFTLGDVTTVNMTMVKGGVAYNVIPPEMDVSFDLRIPPTVNLQVCKHLCDFFM